jgi:16S rRNA (uracil1498-N3)-methyltransferase
VTAPHFFVEAQDDARPGDRIRLSAEDSSHALRSRRLRPGESVTVSNGRTWMGRGRLAGPEDGLAVVELGETWATTPSRHPEVDVTLAPPKGDRLRWAVQKLSELGVRELGLMDTERSVRFPSAGAVGRLSTIAREAAMQSSQPFVPKVLPVHEFAQALASSTSSGGVCLLLHEGASDRLGEVLPDAAISIHLLVGPEGGFSDPEVEQARGEGFLVASLGPSILRTETAAVVGCALVLARYGRLG